MSYTYLNARYISPLSTCIVFFYDHWSDCKLTWLDSKYWTDDNDDVIFMNIIIIKLSQHIMCAIIIVPAMTIRKCFLRPWPQLLLWTNGSEALSQEHGCMCVYKVFMCFVCSYSVLVDLKPPNNCIMYSYIRMNNLRVWPHDNRSGFILHISCQIKTFVMCACGPLFGDQSQWAIYNCSVYIQFIMCACALQTSM